jgi:type VI secretion system secreted protein Hcp
MRFGTESDGGKIKGDCEIRGYENWIVLEGFDFSVGRKIEAAKKGGGRDIETGKGDPQEISISKNVDRATPYLMFQAIQDRTPGNATAPDAIDIHCVESHQLNEQGQREKAGGATVPKSDLKAFLRICLGRALIKTWSISADADGRPTENLSIWFNQIAIAYRRLKVETDKTTGAPVATFEPYGPKGWDQLAGGKGGEWKPPHWK